MILTQDILLFAHIQVAFLFLSCCNTLWKVLLVLLPEVLEMINSESVIHQGAVLPCHQQLAPQFLQLTQRKKLNRHNIISPEIWAILRYIESRLELAAAAIFCQLCFPPNVLTISSYSRRLTMLNSMQRWSEKAKVNKNPARSHVATTEEKGTEV